MKPLKLLFLLASCLLALQGCDTKKKLTKQKESTETTTIHEATQSTRTEIDATWTRVGSSIYDRSGDVVITFDSLTSISIGPDQQIRAVGFNPTIRSQTTETRRDTTSELRTSQTRIQEDSTGSASVREKKEVLTKDLDKVQKAQKIGPIIFLLLLLLALFLIAKFLKLI
jgi:hypothetical protein